MRRSRITLALALLAFLALGLFAWRPVRHLRAVAALEQAIEHGDVGAWSSKGGGSFRELRKYKFATTVADRIFGKEKWEDSYDRWIRFFAEGPIEEIWITCGSIRGDVAGALLRLPHVREVTITTENTNPFRPHDVFMKDGDLARLCAVLPSLQRLEHLTLHGSAILDGTIAPLAGHPKLAVIDIRSHGRVFITTRSIETFASMPSLRQLKLGHLAPSDGLGHKELIDTFKKGLPHVIVEERIMPFTEPPQDLLLLPKLPTIPNGLLGPSTTNP